MLKKMIFSTIVTIYFISLSLAADTSCLQTTESSGIVEQICYTGAGISKSEFEEQCVANNQDSDFMKQTSKIVNECPTGQVGSCEMTSGIHSSTILYYRADIAEQLPKGCEMMGGKWKAAK